MRTLILFIFLAFSINASAQSSVWKVSKGDQHFFVGGTIHLLRKEDHPLPEEFIYAYEQSRTLIFETDIDATQTPEFQAKMFEAFTLKNGLTLDGVLSPAVYEKLEKHLQSRQIPIEGFASMSASGTGILIAVIEYQRMGMEPEWGVESVMHKQAKADGLQFGALESPEQQIAFIANLAEGKEDEMIDYTLKDISRLPAYFEEVKGAWRTGDLSLLESAGFGDLKAQFPSVFEKLIVQRNRAWVNHLKRAEHKPDDVAFVLVGALHLPGELGVLNLLKQEGYTVDQL